MNVAISLFSDVMRSIFILITMIILAVRMNARLRPSTAESDQHQMSRHVLLQRLGCISGTAKGKIERPDGIGRPRWVFAGYLNIQLPGSCCVIVGTFNVRHHNVQVGFSVAGSLAHKDLQGFNGRGSCL